MSCKVVVLANKWWEAVPLVSVLQHAREIKPEFSGCPSAFDILEYRQPRESVNGPRLRCVIDGSAVEVWCLEDLIPKGRNTSSSSEKEKALREFDAKRLNDASLVIAFGTAAAPIHEFNGNVVVGCRVFVFDAHNEEDGSEFVTSDRCGVIVNSTAEQLLQDPRFVASVAEAEIRLLKASNNSSPVPAVHMSPSYVSVGVVNVSDSQAYEDVDRQALEQFSKISDGLKVLSVETTHGLIRLNTDKPFLYVSGIVNEVGAFAEEVKSKRYAQSFAASHNAAVSLAWMLPIVCQRFKEQSAVRK